MKIKLVKDDVAFTLQILAREQLIRKLLADISTDITICKLEGWNWREFPQRIKQEIDLILSERK